MVALYYDCRRTVHFERDTLDLCIQEYTRRRRLYGVDRVGWGHVYIDGERVYL